MRSRVKPGKEILFRYIKPYDTSNFLYLKYKLSLFRQKCSAYYNEYQVLGDIFWETQLDIERKCYDVFPEEWTRSFEFIIRDSELWACIGDGCNNVDIESVLGSEYVPPLSTLPVDASRWEQPVTDEEAQIYCGNGIDCVKCHYCEEVLSKYSY